MGGLMMLLALVSQVPADGDSSELARRFFEAGEQNYAAARYPEAVVNYERAFELSKKPVLLFNVANAHERNGTYAEAAEALERYKTYAPGTDRVAVEHRISSLKERARAKAALATELDTLRTYQRETEIELRSLRGEETAAQWPAYVVGGTGLALIVASIITGVVAVSAGDSAKENCVETAGGLYCTDAAAPDLERQQNLSTVSDVLLAVGATGVVAGGVLLWIQSSPSSEGEAETKVVLSGTF